MSDALNERVFLDEHRRVVVEGREAFLQATWIGANNRAIPDSWTLLVPQRALTAMTAERDEALWAVGWAQEWLAAEKYHKPDVPKIVMHARELYRKSMAERDAARVTALREVRVLVSGQATLAWLVGRIDAMIAKEGL